jgi:hypothetical protein
MKLIITLFLFCIVNLGFSQINKAEYFIDTDPGTDMGFDIPVTEGDDITKSFSINTAGLSLGIHTLYVRTRDINKAWSLFYKHTFLVHDFSNSIVPSEIVAAEYFFDTDPGTDGATPISITSGFNLNKSISISTGSLSDGIHTLYVRTKDEDDRWSLYYKYNFLVHTFTTPTPVAINKAEYFFDEDPGTDAGNPLAITADFSLNEDLAIPSAGLSEGIHFLYIRTKDVNDVWSLYLAKSFEVTPALGIEDNLFLLTRIYPIPATNEITIDTKVNDVKSITLFDFNGRKINTFKAKPQLNTIDVSNYARGIYVLQVKSDEGLLNKKIILE